MDSEKQYDLKSLQNRLEKFERATDSFLFPECYLTIRMDGHRQGADWDEIPHERYPFGSDVRESLIDTTRDMFETDFNIRFAMQHGDEIILILDKTELNNLRKRTRLTSALASAAASFYTKNFQKTLLFHAQISELPRLDLVYDFLLMIKLTAKRNFISRVIQHELGVRNRSKEEISKICSNLKEEVVKEVFEEIGFDLSTVDKGILNGIAFHWEQGPKGPFLKYEAAMPDDKDEYLSIVKKAFSEQEVKKTKASHSGASHSGGKNKKKPLFS